MYVYIYIYTIYISYIYIHICIFVLYNLFPTVIDPPAHVLKNQQVPHADWWSDWYMTYCDSSFTRNSVGDSLFKVWVKLRLLFPHTPKQLYGGGFTSNRFRIVVYFLKTKTTNSVLAVSTWLVLFFQGISVPFLHKKLPTGSWELQDCQVLDTFQCKLSRWPWYLELWNLYKFWEWKVQVQKYWVFFEQFCFFGMFCTK